MKNKKLVVLLSVLVLATAPAVVAATGCDNINDPSGTTQTDEYTFKFVGGEGATGTAPTDVKKKAEETFTLPDNTFTKAGYEFKGWSDGTAATPYEEGATYTAGTAGVTFTAVWKAIDYKVSFDGDGATSGEMADITGKHIGDTVTLPENDFTKDGHTFAGWSVGGEVKQPGVEITVGADNVTVTASWTPIDYTVSFVAGTGTNGKAPADITGKHIGDEVTLPTTTLTKDGYDFDGWSIGGEVKQPNEKITIGTENVTATATWANNYVDNMPGFDGTSGITVKFGDDGKATISDNGIKTVYNYTTAENTVTFVDTEDATVTYTGNIVNGAIVVTVPVQHQYYKGNTSLVLSKTAIALIEDMGSNGYAQTTAFKDKIYMFENGLVLGCEGYGSVVVKYGTYTTVKNHIYSLSFNGDDKSYDLKITLNNGVAFYSLSDGYQGDYTLGSDTVTFDGFGNWTNGTYTVITDGTNTMVYLVDAENLSDKLYSLSGTTLTEITNEKAGQYTTKAQDQDIETIYFNGTDLAGIVYSDYGGNKFLEVITVTAGTASTVEINYTDYEVKLVADGVFRVKRVNSYNNIYYTLNDATYVEPTPDVADGTYVNNLDSDITAAISTAEGVKKLTLSKGGSSATYNMVLGDAGELILTSGSSAIKAYIVNGVIYASGVKASSASTTYHVALTSTALTSVSGAEAGYFVKPGSTSYALYIYTNGVAVYRTYYSTSSHSASGKIATYTKDGDEYTLTFADGTTASVTYKVIADSEGTPAYYAESDGLKGNYTVGSDTYELDGYGSYTKGSETGKYVAGKNGFTLVKNNAVDKVYKIDGTTLVEASETEELVNKGGNTNTTLTNEGIKLKTADVYTGCGCAVISYTVTVDGTEGEVQTVKVTLGMTFSITVGTGDDAITESFMVTKATDSEFIISRSGTTGSVTFGIPGGGVG